MKNITLTTVSDRELMINWDNVTFAKDTSSHFGDKYVEIHFGESTIDVKESLEDIEQKLNGKDGK